MKKTAKYVVCHGFALLTLGLSVGCTKLAPVSGLQVDQTYPNRLDYQMVQTQKQFSDRYCCSGNGNMISADKHYFFGPSRLNPR